MRNTVIWCCLSILSTILIVGSCTNTYGEFDISQSPIGFLRGLNEVTVTFPTDVPNQTVRFKFKKKANAIRPQLKDALRFVKLNQGYKEVYKRDAYDCKQFAYNLFIDAQKENYEAGFVILRLKNESIGHAVAAIETADAGTLYVDFTPFMTKNDQQKHSQTVAFVKEGEPYIRIPLNSLSPNFTNSEADFKYFYEKVKMGEKEVKKYNELALSLEEQKKAVAAKIGKFNSKVGSGRIAAASQEAIQSEHEALQREVDDVNSRYDHLNFEEARIKSLYFFADWVGNTWVIESLKMLP
ncbi:MAG: hypothetical protein R3A80_11405 [Bdellovibrionota bacterium]